MLNNSNNNNNTQKSHMAVALETLAAGGMLL